MSSMKTILITGVTGKQGGAVAHHLTGKGFHLRGLTRKPDSDAARAFKDVEMVKGDLDDEDSLKAALKGVWGVFSVQNSRGEKEEEQGKRLAKLAKQAGVEHFVYTSVGSAHKKTGIPHFDSKFRIEGAVKEQNFKSHVIIRPVFFMENLVSPMFLQGEKLISTLKPETKVQMIAVDDIGRIGAAAFTDQSLKGHEIDIAGDCLTMPETALAMSEVFKKNISYQKNPIEEVKKYSKDLAIMLEWFDAVGYSADIAALEKQFGKLKKLPDFLKSSSK